MIGFFIATSFRKVHGATAQPDICMPKAQPNFDVKAKQLFAGLSILSLALFAPISRAADITATGSGNWSSTVPDAPWPGGVVPGTNDDVDVEAPFNITVDTNASIQYIYGSGKVTMATGSTLNVIGNPAGSQGTYQLAVLDATAVSNTVVYTGNPFWAKQCDYYNLVFANTNYVDPLPPYLPWQDFNNFSGSGGPTPMTIAGNMTLMGAVKVQQGGGGAPITIDGNLIIGRGCAWDCSGDILTVRGNAYIYGLLEDLNGALGTNRITGNAIVAGPSNNIRAYAGGPYTNGWFVSDVITWGVGGSLSNNGAIYGTGFGSIIFDGTGVIAGSNALLLPTMTVNGTYTIGTAVTLVTNTPTLNGTLIFDLANAKQIVLLTNAGTALYYSGNLEVTNSGAPPSAGAHYQLFNCTNGFGGAFNSTIFPGLPGGLSWVDNLATSGSIAVTGSAAQSIITAWQFNPISHQFTVTWTSVPAVTYSILYSSNLTAGFNNVLATGVPSGGSSTTNTVTLPNGNVGFVRIRQP
jgi:hypothetical protein